MGLQVKNLDRVKRNYEKRVQKLKNPTTAMGIIAGMMQKDVMGHFNEGKSPTGSWKPLKHSPFPLKRL